MKTLVNIFIPIIIFIFSLNNSYGQCFLVNSPLEDRIVNSNIIIEGQVIDIKSYWDTKHHNIYTSNTVEVIQVIKGDITSDQIEVITLGGTIGLKKEVVRPNINFSKGHLGLFLINKSNIILTKNKTSYDLSYSSLGFVEYNLNKNIASDQFNVYNNIESDIHQTLRNIGYKVNNKTIKDLKHSSKRNLLVVAISSFTPTTITAGTQDVLTISGSGFGATQGAGEVQFTNGSSTIGTINITPIPNEYISWTDTEIQVEVPNGAGSGKIKVIDNGGSSMESSTDLTITYNLTNIWYPSNSTGSKYRTNLVDADGSGGIEFEFFTDFYNDLGSRNAFIRALESWRCSTGNGTSIYFEDGGSTVVDVDADDGTNIVRYDNGSELPSSVLGIARSRYTGCSSGGAIKWVLEELDVTFNDIPNNSSFTWNTDEADNSTSSTEYDLESVAVHELGHGHQLGHVQSTSDIMYPALSNMQEKRPIGVNNYDAGTDVINFSSGYCSKPIMDIYSCSPMPLTILDFTALPMTSSIIIDWHTTNEINIDQIILQRATTFGLFHPISIKKPCEYCTDKQSYQHIDIKIKSNTEYQYRIKVLDRDGSYEYSDIITTELISKREDIYFYPNPGKGIFTLQLPHKNIDQNIEIIDKLGKNVFNLTTNKEEVELDLSSFPAGYYHLVINKTTSQPLVVLP